MSDLPSTYQGYLHSTGRGSGNTTRQADNAIQLLFIKGGVKIRDHYGGGHHKDANRKLFEIVLTRLKNEHRLDRLLEQGLIEIDRSKFTIKLNYQGPTQASK